MESIPLKIIDNLLGGAQYAAQPQYADPYANPYANPYAGQNESSGGSGGLVIFIVLLVLVGIGVGVYFWYKANYLNDDDDSGDDDSGDDDSGDDDSGDDADKLDRDSPSAGETPTYTYTTVGIVTSDVSSEDASGTGQPLGTAGETPTYTYTTVGIVTSDVSSEDASGTGQPLGGSCAIDEDCANYNQMVGEEGVQCCGDPGVCTEKIQEMGGYWYCPNEVNAETWNDGAIMYGGNTDDVCTLSTHCKDGYCCDYKCVDPNSYNFCNVSGVDWCRNSSGTGNYNANNDGTSAGTVCDDQPVGGVCSTSFNCANYNVNVAEPGVYCCDGVCENKVKDWADQYYCSDEAVLSEPLSDEGGSCVLASDCSGSLGCCDYKCEELTKDINGTKVCDWQIHGTKYKSGATYFKGDKNDYCLFPTDCKSGRGCCKNKCEDLVKDWFGTCYCKHECSGSCKSKC